MLKVVTYCYEKLHIVSNASIQEVFMKKIHFLSIFILIAVSFLSLYPPLAYAETKEIIGEGTYHMGDGETPTIAEEQALLAAKRTALEEAGTYVESYSKVENFQLTHDEIQVLSAGIIEVNILDKKRTVESNGGICFWVKISAKITTDKIADMAHRIKDKSVVDDYKNLQDNLRKSQQEIEALKTELQQAKNSQQKEQIKVQISNKELWFQSNIWLDKGHQLAISKLYGQAIHAYDQAISSYPRYAQVYASRGRAYMALKQYGNALADFNYAIAINPNSSSPYLTKGIALEKLNRPAEAIEAYRQFILYVPTHHSQYIRQIQHRIKILEAKSKQQSYI